MWRVAQLTHAEITVGYVFQSPCVRWCERLTHRLSSLSGMAGEPVLPCGALQGTHMCSLAAATLGPRAWGWRMWRGWRIRIFLRFITGRQCDAGDLYRRQKMGILWRVSGTYVWSFGSWEAYWSLGALGSLVGYNKDITIKQQILMHGWAKHPLVDYTIMCIHIL